MGGPNVPCLVLLSEQLGDHVYALKGAPTLIGRAGTADIRLPDAQISSRHAEVFQRDGRWCIRDLASKNGTRVNGEPLGERERVLRPNDRIEVGSAATLFFTDKRFDEGPTKKIALGPEGSAFTGTVSTGAAPAKAEPAERDATPSGRSVFAPEDVKERLLDVRPARVEGGLDERRISILYQLAEALGKTRTEQELLDHALELTLALIPADRAYIFLGDSRVLGGRGPILPAVCRRRPGTGTEVAISTTILEEVLATRTAVATTDAASDERFMDAHSVVRHGIRAVTAAPIITQDQVLGVIYLDSTAPGYQFSRGELMLLSAIAFQAGLALENARFVRCLEDRVAERTVEIERLSSDRAKLLAIAAHDLKTPLSGVLGYLECLAPQAEADPGAAWLAPELALLADSVRDLIDLLVDLLDRQRAEAGKIELAPEPTDLGALLGDLATRYERWAKGAGRSVHLEVEPGLPVAHVDPRRLKQILNNLVHNALKYTPRDGRVFIRAKVGGAGVSVTVGDEGKGFDAAETGRLVGFFERGTANEPPVGVGHGLGLAIVDKLVGLLGGKLEVESRIGAGARFTFTIPAGKKTPVAK